jgi:hypothetical protein
MCYTANDSLLGYIINSIFSILLYNIANDAQFKVIALFFLFVGQMQILDFAFWKNQSCNLSNKIATKLAIGINHLQPIVLFLLQTFYGFKQSTISFNIFWIYIIYGIFYNIEAFTKINCTLPIDGIMKWKWNHMPGNGLNYTLFVSYLFTASFNFKDNIFKIITALATLLTLFISFKTPNLNISQGRIWCYYAAFMPIVFICLYYFNHS